MNGKTWTEQRSAKDPVAYVAAFGDDFTWGHKRIKVELVEVLPGQTPSGRKRFIIRFTEEQ